MVKTETIIALGSNTETDEHIAHAIAIIAETLPGTRFSRLMTTEPIGNYDRMFTNCIATTVTDRPASELVKLLKEIERTCGDTRQLRSHGTVMLDADLLLCNGTRYHEADWHRPYIKTLMAEMNTGDTPHHTHDTHDTHDTQQRHAQ